MVTGVPQHEPESLDEDESWFVDAWRDSRAGSRAGRGFHFQDAVGAWLASRLASGDLAADRLTPEGFDDLQVEATDPVQVEVKSRQDRLGPFPVGVAASHIVDAWIRHSGRFGTERRLVVVLERGLAGLESDPDRTLTELPIAEIIGEVDGLGDALAARLASQEQASTALARIHRSKLDGAGCRAGGEFGGCGGARRAVPGADRSEEPSLRTARGR